MQTLRLSTTMVLAFAVLMVNPAFATDPTQAEKIPDPDATILSTNVILNPADGSIGTAALDVDTEDPNDWDYTTSANDGATGKVHAGAIVQWKDGTVRTLTADEDVTLSSGEGAADTLQMTFTVKPA